MQSVLVCQVHGASSGNFCHSGPSLGPHRCPLQQWQVEAAASQVLQRLFSWETWAPDARATSARNATGETPTGGQPDWSRLCSPSRWRTKPPPRQTRTFWGGYLKARASGSICAEAREDYGRTAAPPHRYCYEGVTRASSDHQARALRPRLHRIDKVFEAQRTCIS